MTYVQINNTPIQFPSSFKDAKAVHNGRDYQIVERADTQTKIRRLWSIQEIITVVALTVLGILPGIIVGAYFCYHNQAKWHKNSPPHIYVYTTGLAEPAVRERWNKFYHPYLKTLPYKIECIHFDPESPGSMIEGGIFKREKFPLEYLQQTPSVLFDFAHAVEDYDEYPTALYIPYEDDVGSEKFLDFGLTPFSFEKDQIVTYHTELKKRNYQVITKTMPFTDKWGKAIEIAYKTVKIGHSCFDTEEKLKYLYKLIKEQRLFELLTDLETATFYQSILDQVPQEFDKDMPDLLHQAMRARRENCQGIY